MLSHRGRVSRGPDGDRQGGHPAGLHAPAQEGLGGSAGGVVFAVPGVEVGLPAVFGEDATAGEPGQEGTGLDQLLPGLACRRVAQRSFVGFGPQFTKLVPGGEAVQYPGVFGVGDGGKMPGQPSLEQHELPVDGGQDPALHEYVAQVGGGPPVR